MDKLRDGVEDVLGIPSSYCCCCRSYDAFAAVTAVSVGPKEKLPLSRPLAVRGELTGVITGVIEPSLPTMSCDECALCIACLCQPEAAEPFGFFLLMWPRGKARGFVVVWLLFDDGVLGTLVEEFFRPQIRMLPSRVTWAGNRPSSVPSLFITFLQPTRRIVGTFFSVLDWMLLFCCFAWAFCGCKYVFLSEQNCLTPVALTERCCQHVCSRQTNPHESLLLQ